jgi:hypothetical protein
VESIIVTSAIFDNGLRELSIGVRSELEGVPSTMNEDELKGLLFNAMLARVNEKKAD